METELLIVGAGAAGMTAALSAWEAGCRDILLADRRETPGGILPQCLHEGFGLTRYGAELTGPDYAGRIAQRLKKTGIRLALGTEVLTVGADRTAVLSSRRGLTEMQFA
ncbi:MAG: NAD(P)-binding protein, partial [Clostridia bacterium]|nr:NAD(P)-binding protein [Clostridia bacterium]